jgi:hypothetical protein
MLIKIFQRKCHRENVRGYGSCTLPSILMPPLVPKQENRVCACMHACLHTHLVLNKASAGAEKLTLHDYGLLIWRVGMWQMRRWTGMKLYCRESDLCWCMANGGVYMIQRILISTNAHECTWLVKETRKLLMNEPTLLIELANIRVRCIWRKGDNSINRGTLEMGRGV